MLFEPAANELAHFLCEGGHFLCFLRGDGADELINRGVAFLAAGVEEIHIFRAAGE